MNFMRRFAALLLIVVGVFSLESPAPAMAHQDGCHSAHSCPSDASPPSYTCGDTGNYTYCPGLSGSASVYGGAGATVGSPLSASISWSVAVSAATKTYQWYRSGTAIPGATTASYVLTPEDFGQPFVVTATATDGRGQTASASSSPVTPTYPAPPTGTAKLSASTATVGTAVTATVAWTKAVTSTTYQWSRAGVAIPGAIASTYAVTPEDVGQALVLTAIAVDQFGQSATASSLPITPAYPPLPIGTATLITSSATVGTAVTASIIWNRPATTTYQWFRAGVPIAGATAATYVATKDDLGQPLKLVATVTEYGRTVSVSTAALTPMAKSKITLKTRRTIRAGTKAVARGTLTTVAGAAGRTVKVKAWQKVGRRWVVRKTTKVVVSSTGTFTVKQRISAARKGAWRFKASYAGTTGISGAQSPYATLVAR